MSFSGVTSMMGTTQAIGQMGQATAQSQMMADATSAMQTGMLNASAEASSVNAECEFAKGLLSKISDLARPT